MADRPSGELERPVNSLAELRLGEESLDSVLAHVGRLGLDSLDGWHAVGASVVENERVATFGISDERVRPIDQGQYDTGHGPCVDAIKQAAVQYYDGTTEPQWRAFAERAAERGIYSVLSFPLTIGDEVLGGLNFYSEERDALRPGQREEGLLFAAQAAVAIANMQALGSKDVQVEQLEDGLQTRTMIGQATGLLMAQDGLSSEEAFQKLVKVSQTSNVKLRDIAKKYVESWEEKTKGTSSPSS